MESIEDFMVELPWAAQDLATLSGGEKFVSRPRVWRDTGRLAGYERTARLEESTQTMDLTKAGGILVHRYDDEMKAILLEAAKGIQKVEAAITAKRRHRATGRVSDERSVTVA